MQNLSPNSHSSLSPNKRSPEAAMSDEVISVSFFLFSFFFFLLFSIFSNWLRIWGRGGFGFVDCLLTSCFAGVVTQAQPWCKERTHVKEERGCFASSADDLRRSFLSPRPNGLFAESGNGTLDDRPCVACCMDRT